MNVISLAMRTVRTPEGERKYGEPIGSVIQVNRDGEPILKPGDGTDSGQSENEANQGGDKVQQNTAQRLVDHLISKGADAKRAKAAVQQVSSESLAQTFVAKLEALSSSSSKKETLPGTGNADTSAASTVGNIDKAQSEFRVVNWRGKEIQVPKGARIGQVSGKGEFPAVFYWYDTATGEVHGMQSDGKAIPAVEVPAGQSLKSFFTDFVESGGSGFPLKRDKKSKLKFSEKALLQGEAEKDAK